MKLIRLAAFGITAIITLVLITASIVENSYGTDTAKELFYTSPLTIALWAAVCACGTICILRKLSTKNYATITLHISFVIILTGALTTHIFGEKGTVNLLTGDKPVDCFKTTDGQTSTFPFMLRLTDCITEYYPGTKASMDYISHIEITEKNGEVTTGTISMNNVMEHRGYRLYQTAIGSDSSMLSVSHDPWGIGITYAGYALLLISMILFFVQRTSRFRRLLAHPTLRKGFIICAAIAMPALSAMADESRPRALQRGLAGSFGNLYVYYNDRVCPLQTMAHDFCTKLYGKSSYKGLTAEQVMTGWIFYYEDWKKEPMIKVKGKKTKELLGIDGGYARLSDFYDFRGYKLEEARKSLNDKDIQSADEKCNLISMICTGAAIKIYPYSHNGSVTWLSWVDNMPHEIKVDDWKFIIGSMEYVAKEIQHGRNIEANKALHKIREYQQKKAGADNLPTESRFKTELCYNRYSNTRPVAIACVTIGLLAFIFFCRNTARHRALPKWTSIALTAASVAVLAYLSAAIVMRSYISGHLPLSNGFETMQFLAWCSLAVTLLLRRKFTFVTPFGFLICGIALLVAMMGEANPPITHLMPVLASPLLSLHVVVIMLAYALLAITALNSIAAIAIRKEAETERFMIVSNLLLYPAVFLLAIGIFVGAVWANQSWGAYWSWDPKETWALITLLIYSFPLHSASLPMFRRPILFHVYVLAAFLSVLMTYFGVNYVLGGMHSYA